MSSRAQERIVVPRVLSRETVGRPRIGLNLLYLRPRQVGGTETYARGLLSGLQATRPPCDIVVFLNRKAWSTFSSLDSQPGFQRVLCESPLSPTARHCWEQLRFPALCQRHKIDLLHSLGYVSPLRLACASVVTVHDLLYRRAPQWISLPKRLFWSAMIPLSVKTCDAVITVSRESCQDIVRLLGVPEHKVHVTPEGPGQEWEQLTPREQVRQKYRLPEGFFLSVGADAHKRLDVTLEALRILRHEGICAALVVTGNSGERSLELLRADGSVNYLGYVPAADLASLYRQAVALVCSSQLEGFGLPVLEAMAAGTPVISSDSGSLPEVVGEGGALVTGGDPARLAETLRRILCDPAFREDLCARGRSRVQAFSWQSCAAATLESYETVLRKRGHSSCCLTSSVRHFSTSLLSRRASETETAACEIALPVTSDGR